MLLKILTFLHHIISITRSCKTDVRVSSSLLHICSNFSSWYSTLWHYLQLELAYCKQYQLKIKNLWNSRFESFHVFESLHSKLHKFYNWLLKKLIYVGMVWTLCYMDTEIKGHFQNFLEIFSHVVNRPTFKILHWSFSSKSREMSNSWKAANSTSVDIVQSRLLTQTWWFNAGNNEKTGRNYCNFTVVTQTRWVETVDLGPKTQQPGSLTMQ